MGPMSGNGSHMCDLKFIFIVAETHWAIQYFIVQLLFIFSVVLPLLSHPISPFSFFFPPSLFLFSTSPSNFPLSHYSLFLFPFSSELSHELFLLLLPLIFPWHPSSLFSLQVLCHLLPAFGLQEQDDPSAHRINAGRLLGHPHVYLFSPYNARLE